MLAQTLNGALERRKLSVNAASLRFGVSREAITKLLNARPVEVLIVEKLATGLGADVNEWRELAGYPRVESEPDEDRLGILRAFDGEENNLPPESLDLINQVIRDEVEGLRRERDGEAG